MIEIVLIAVLFFGAWTYKLVNYRERLTCEQYQNQDIDITGLDIKEHFYHNHKPRRNRDKEAK